MHAPVPMLIGFRVVRALIGVLGLIMLKASLQPGYEFFVEGQADLFVTFLWRFVVGAVAIGLFFHLRSSINRAYGTAGNVNAPLGSIWSL